MSEEVRYITLSQVVKDYLDHVSTPEDKNDLGNGWYNGYRSFQDFWNEPEDADFEIIEPLQLPSPTTKTSDI